MAKQHWQDWITILIGIWLLLTTIFLTFTPQGAGVATATVWNFAACGVVALALGFAALIAFRLWQEWLTMLLGLWLIVSPWVLNDTGHADPLWNSVVSGIVLVLTSTLVMLIDQGERRT
ncbi:SPW repeat protein [Aureimonas sp. AU4]|uniref:SPW repeat protein n=1 Tax=Aureimonas sp. AU4 TaxID=1638163 RepID=UPI0007804D76|nr:SPW repeat protein [Aureimonas sp. AU4]